MKRVLLILIGITLTLSASAQKEQIKSVKSVRGEFAVVLSVSDVTGREATNLAREDAKRKAIEEVCGTHVNIWDKTETSAAGDTFNSLSLIQTEGEIVEFTIIDEGNYQSDIRQSETIFYCIADVKVKRSSARDPQFYIAVNGLKSIYLSGDILKFSVTPHYDCYMTIFLMENDKVGYMLYPNQYDQTALLPASKEWKIEDSPYYEFEITKSTDAQREVNRLVFVFTKTPRPFNNQITSRADIEKWIASIPNDQKYLHFSIFEIREN
ncbi:MAG: DUF4384 domain-containing protein [Alistipes sp.]|nr:DUF4384 domain-containing protein [Alistipes sp.]